MSTSKRFSKATVTEHILARVEHLRKEHRLDPGNGTAQLRGGDEVTAVAYGEFRGLLNLLDRINGGYL